MMMTSAMAEALVQGGERGRLLLTVLYDERCPLCRRLKDWLGDQPTLASVAFMAADSAEAHARFPTLDHARTTRILTVVTSSGAVYEGERAWLICGWVLPSWQPVAEHFGNGIRLHFVRLAARVVDGYRHRLITNTEPCDRCGVAAPAPRPSR
jgi:predicted DCC family thiol-disulfide oxidoreductase YuxK